MRSRRAERGWECGHAQVSRRSAQACRPQPTHCSEIALAVFRMDRASVTGPARMHVRPCAVRAGAVELAFSGGE